MSTAFIIASVFLTGAVIANRDTNASNTLFFLFIIATLTGAGIWASQHFA
jgi:hypothetical protein